MDWVPHSQALAGRHVVVKPGQLLVDKRCFPVDSACRLEVEVEQPPVWLFLGLLAAAAAGLPLVHALQAADAVEAPWLVAVPALAGVVATYGLVFARTTYALVLCRGARRQRLFTTDDAGLAPVVEALVREAASLARAGH